MVFLSLSDSDSNDELDDSESEEEEVELDFDDDLSDGERVGFLFFWTSLTGDTTDLALLLFDELEAPFVVRCGGGGGEGEDEGDFRLDFDTDCS